jgi:hypothetical protein
MPWHMSIVREEVRESDPKGGDTPARDSRILPESCRTRAARRYFARFNMRFRSRTPGPPPFSSMNSTPAVKIGSVLSISVLLVCCASAGRKLRIPTRLRTA